MSDLVLGIRLTADGKDLVGAVKVSTDEIDKMTGATKRAGSEAEKLNTQQKGLGQSLNDVASRIGAYTIGWNVAADAVMKAAGAIKDYIKEAALLNARHETMGVVLEVVGRNAGYSRREMDMYAESVRKSGITMIAARESVTKMVQANLDLAIAGKLARAAQDAAVIANINSSEAFTRLIYGIQSGQTEMLRTMGINVNFEASYQKLSKQLKVTTEQLTEQEKTQARANVVLEASTRITGTYEAAMGTAGKMMNSLARYTEDLKVMRGEVFNEALVIAVNAYTDSLKAADTETRRLADNKKLQEWGRDLVYTFAWIGDIIAGAFDAIATAVEQTARGAMVALNGLRKAALMGFPGADMMAKLLGSATGHDIDAYIESFGKKADANMAARVKRVQLRASAEEYYEKKHLDEMKRLLKAENDAYEEADLQRGADARRAAAAGSGTRPTGKGDGEDPMKAIIKSLKEKLLVDRELNEVNKLHIALEEMSAKQRAKASPELQAKAEILAREVDLNNRLNEQWENTAKNEEALTKMRDEVAAATANYDNKIGDAILSSDKMLEQMKFENTLIGLTNTGREAAIQIRALETAGIDKESWAYKNLSERIRALYADRDAKQAVVDLNKKNLDEFNDFWRSVESTGKSVFNILADRGKNMAERIGEAIKSSIVDMLYQLTVRKWIINIGTSITGMAGLSGAANAASTGSSIFSAGSMASNIGGLFSSGMDFGAGFAATAFAPAAEAAMMIEAGTVGAAGAGMEAGALMTVGSAMPYVALAVAAAYALGLFDDGEDMSQPAGAPNAYYTNINAASRQGGASSYYTGTGPRKDDGTYSMQGFWTPDQTAAIDKMVTSLFSSFDTAAKRLGVSAAPLSGGFHSDFSVAHAGTTPGDALNAAMASLSDTLALALIPNIKALQQSGESLTQTFQRLLVIQDQQHALAYSMMSSDQQLAYNTKQLSDGFTSLGLAVPQSKDAFRQLVEGLDITTLSGQSTLGVLMQLGPIFTQVAEASAQTVVAGRSAVDIANERNDLQGELNALTDTAAEALARQRNALDESNRALFDQVTAAEAARVAAEDLAASQLAIANERQGLQEQLNALTDTAAEALTRQRNALDESNRALFDQVAAAQAAKTAAEALAASQLAIANERQGLQEQLNALTDTAAEALARQRNALDESNRALFDQVTAAQAANAIANERTGLQEQLNALTYTAAEALARQRNALDESNRALFDQVQAATAAAAAARDLAAAQAATASQRYGLETRLLQAQGNTATLRTRELTLLDESNRPLQLQIWALEDQAAANAIAAQAAQQAANAARQAASDQEQAAAAQQRAAEQLKSAWQSVTDSIISEVERIRGLAGPTPESLAAAQSQFAIATAQSRAGDQEAAKALPSLSRSILDMAFATATTSVDVQRLRGQVQGSLAVTAELLARQYGLTLPGFAVGTDYLPKDMPLYAHKGERITPAAYNRSDATNAELLTEFQAMRDELKGLRAEVAGLRAPADQTAANTKSTADTLDNATGGGGPMLVEIA